MSKWTREEELELIKDVARGVDLNYIAKARDRTASAIELRLKKIIYENAIAGKKIENISKLLNIPHEKVRQYFYSYKEFKEKQTGKVEDLTNLKINHSDIYGSNHISNNHDDLFSKVKTTVDKINYENEHKHVNKHYEIYNPNSHNSHNAHHNKYEHVSLAAIDTKIKQLEMENKYIELVFQNKKLNHELKKKIKEGDVSSSVKDVIKIIRSNKIN